MSKTTIEKIASIEAQVQQLENERKRLIQLQKEADRKARTKRLIERGAILEGLISGADTFTNEQIKMFLEKTIQSEYARKILDSIVSQKSDTIISKSVSHNADTNYRRFVFREQREEERVMAIYHCSIKIISRGKGKSAVAAAAYRAGELIKNEYDGINHDYTRKGGIVHTEILLPQFAPREYADRTPLWNAVEKIEKAKNSQLAREIELALPKELSLEQNISLVREYISGLGNVRRHLYSR